MTKDEFYSEMGQLDNKYVSSSDGDIELFHILADDLMCKLLIELGYGKGVEIFLDAPKWYS